MEPETLKNALKVATAAGIMTYILKKNRDKKQLEKFRLNSKGKSNYDSKDITTDLIDSPWSFRKQ